MSNIIQLETESVAICINENIETLNLNEWDVEKKVFVQILDILLANKEIVCLMSQWQILRV